MVSIATTAMLLGSRMLPDHRHHIKQQRAALSESLAVTAQVALQTKTFDNAKAVLAAAVQRNNDLLSAGIRSRNGKQMAEAGSHFEHWPSDLDNKSTDAFMQIPIFLKAGDKDPTERCRLEMRFEPVMPTNVWAALLFHPWAKFVPFFSIATFLVYRWYLGRVFQHLDPEKAVPQRVRSAYDFLAGGLVAMDKNQRIVLANSAFSDIVGIPREKLLAQNLGTLPWVRTNKQPFPWDTVYEDRSREVRAHLQIASPQAGQRTLMVNATPVIGQDGNYRGVLVSFEDITPLESAKAEAERSKNAAEAANVAKSAFLANMSHEIRTPMNAILGFAELMKRGFDLDVSERNEYVEIIHSSGQHLLGLINDILDLSKVESGRMELEWIDCQPHQLLHEIVNVMKARAAEKSIDIGFTIEGSIPETIKADPLRLRQILTNLTGNALKFTDQGSVHLLAKTYVRNDDVPMLVFEVRDTGIGIPDDKLEKIFSPFSQADESTTRRYGGTGLGLSISRKLAEMMGGSITARSVMGQGSSFFAEIQLYFDPGTPLVTHEQASQKLEAIQEHSQGVVTLPPGHVLVVDDGESNRKLIELILTRAGVTVSCATNGEEAVKAVLTNSFDAILMDVQMPVMDGYTAMELIREAGYTLPIVALTAHAMKEEQERALNSGFSHFLPKPVNIDNLLALVAELLGGAVLRQPPADPRDHNGKSSTAAQSASSLLSEEAITCSLPMDDEDFRAISCDFVEKLRGQLERFVSLFDERDFEGLAVQAHWLKGAGGTAGFKAFTEVARELEKAAKQQDVTSSRTYIADIIDMTKRVHLPGLVESTTT
jgi:PAS domain S-box-containing protein